MSQERLNRVLVGPIVSEKSTMLADKNNQIAFRVVNCCSRCRSNPSRSST